VLNVFSFGSSFERKNPIALVEAFRLAFRNDPDAELVLKMSHGARHADEMARLKRAVADMANVVLIDAVWDEARLAALKRSADVYASLHRSEGFGLPIAEAIMAGVPVIATNWSGNVDFCPTDCTFPVDYALVPFRDSHPDYDAVGDARWAHPAVAHAAQQLRRVRGDLAAAREKAQRARQALVRHLRAFSYETALASLRHDPVAAKAQGDATPRIGRPLGEGAQRT
jgi:glycosyltransferase involved in cell wall biosynthesis